MLPTAEAERMEKRQALVRTAALVLPLLVISPLWIAVHPLIMVIFLMLVLVGAWGCHRLSLRKLRRRRAILAQPFPESWERVLRERVRYYAYLPEEGRTRLRQLMQIILAEKRLEGTGVEIDDTLRALVGAGAAIPVLGLEGWEYERLEVVVIRPEPFEAHFSGSPDSPLYASGMVGDHSIFSGALVLSLPDMQRDFRSQAERGNVVIHEFAHLVDLATGHIDGVPPGLDAEQIGAWVGMVERFLAGAEERVNADIAPNRKFFDQFRKA